MYEKSPLPSDVFPGERSEDHPCSSPDEEYSFLRSSTFIPETGVSVMPSSFTTPDIMYVRIGVGVLVGGTGVLVGGTGTVNST